MTVQEYYDLYLKKEDEDVCENCGKKTSFENMNKGYRRYCSQKCLKEQLQIKDSEVIRQMKRSRRENVDESASAEKRRETCMKKYEVNHVKKTEVVNKKYAATCMKRYGTTHTLDLDHVKDKRLSSLEENKEEINEKRKEWWTEENIKSVNNTRDRTMLDRYGVKNLMELDEVKQKIAESNYNSGHWTPFDKKDEWDQYCILVQKETKKHLETLFENWDGTCYYFGYKLIPFTGEYDPYEITIDHKVSKKYGFMNNISPKEIGNIDNLCVCSRVINCVKNSLTEEEFYQSDRYKSMKIKGKMDLSPSLTLV